MIFMRDFIRAHLSNEDTEKFAEWAFGANYKSIPDYFFYKEWNRLHSDKMELDGNSIPSNDIPFMIEIWKESIE